MSGSSTLLDDLRHAAPTWSAAIANRIVPHDGQAIPGDVKIAWLYRQLEEELARRNALDAEALQRLVEDNRKMLREVELALIDLKAWKAQLERVQKNHSIRQALVGWLDSVKRLKSTQKQDIRIKLLGEASLNVKGTTLDAASKVLYTQGLGHLGTGMTKYIALTGDLKGFKPSATSIGSGAQAAAYVAQTLPYISVSSFSGIWLRRLIALLHLNRTSSYAYGNGT